MVVGRLAPSPTGPMHLGNAFSSLLAWLSVRSHGGHLLLRIEDLDPARSSEAYTQQLMRDLTWLGLDWDEAITPAAGLGYDSQNRLWRQSRRSAHYTEMLHILQKQHRVYPCYCTRAQLHAASAPHQSDGQFVYDGRCRRLTRQQAEQLAAARSPALRIQVPDTDIAFVDGLQGPYAENLTQNCGDFILRRSDGVFAYQLAVCADDGALGVTQVVRGQDLRSSTPRQIWLLQALGYPVPQYYHVPLLLAADKRRLAKRDRDLDFNALRKTHSPQALVGWLAHLAGLIDRPEPVQPADLVSSFQWRRVRQDNIVLGGTP